ncbi:MAG TPA: 50S ribosomal protein L10 [Patescibacteria group bacterium]|nr:50S ribosomal protein L10 [Patescibacteria group bacterium]
MKKAEKVYFVDNLSATIKSATGVVLIDYTGLAVKQQQELKKRLRGVGATMTVSKNTLFKLAADKAESPKEISTDTVLEGPTALVVTEGDPIAALQVLDKFAKEFEIPSLKVGVIEGLFQDKNALLTLSKLPGKSALQAAVLGAIQAPVYGLLGTLQGNLQKLVFILKTKSISSNTSTTS